MIISPALSMNPDSPPTLTSPNPSMNWLAPSKRKSITTRPAVSMYPQRSLRVPAIEPSSELIFSWTYYLTTEPSAPDPVSDTLSEGRFDHRAVRLVGPECPQTVVRQFFDRLLALVWRKFAVERCGHSGPH